MNRYVIDNISKCSSIPEECVELIYNINEPIENIDLKNVHILKLCYSFNQPIENLDLKNVHTLIFGDDFNQPIEKLDLKNVHTLKLGDKFDQPIENLDLKNVKDFKFKYKYKDIIINQNEIIIGDKTLKIKSFSEFKLIFKVVRNNIDDLYTNYYTESEHKEKYIYKPLINIINENKLDYLTDMVNILLEKVKLLENK